jgi:hypothetical protein
MAQIDGNGELIENYGLAGTKRFYIKILLVPTSSKTCFSFLASEKQENSIGQK